MNFVFIIHFLCISVCNFFFKKLGFWIGRAELEPCKITIGSGRAKVKKNLNGLGLGLGHMFICILKIKPSSNLPSLAMYRSNGRESENNDFAEFYEKNKINHNFSTPRTSKQNGVVERKNRCLKEMARTILNESLLPKSF